MSDFTVPVQEMLFVARHVLGFDAHYESIGASDATPDVVDAILAEGARFSEQELVPMFQTGDQGCRFEDGCVTTPPGFREAYQKYAENGWPSVSGPAEFDGQGLPDSLGAMLHEMFATANMAWFQYPGLSEGAIATLMRHGSEELKATYLPSIVSGEWLSTMCLTEPHCGSDLGLLKTAARPSTGDAFEITGTKIFITAGEHDFSDNIIHLVLARLDGAPEGVRGISLFVVPKILQDGSRNGVQCGAIEHKMGIRGNATAVMNFDQATGYIVGKPNEGLKNMFTFMNSARVGAARLGVCIAERSYQRARDYALERLAMRSLSGPAYPDKPADPIIVHPDVRRMLLTQRVIAEGGRTFIYYLQKQIDLVEHGPTEDERQCAERRLALLTPIAKGAVTELGLEAASLGIQVFGGHGFIVETGIEQIARDARITSIWEGTTGIQGLDLLGRKVIGSKGSLLRDYTDEIVHFCEQNQGDEKLDAYVTKLDALVSEWHDLTDLLTKKAAEDPEEIGAASVDYLMYSGYIVLGYQWALMAKAALENSQPENASAGFYEAKSILADFYFSRLLPRAEAHRLAMISGAGSIMGLGEGQF